jgi:hypothetical protein
MDFLLVCFKMATARVLFALMAIAFTGTLLCMVNYFIKLIKLLPDSLITAKRINQRLQPLAVSACAALFLGAMYYWAITFDIPNGAWQSGFPAKHSYIFDSICVLCIESIPSLIIVRLLARTEPEEEKAHGTQGRSMQNIRNARSSFSSSPMFSITNRVDDALSGDPGPSMPLLDKDEPRHGQERSGATSHPNYSTM